MRKYNELIRDFQDKISIAGNKEVAFRYGMNQYDKNPIAPLISDEVKDCYRRFSQTIALDK